MTDAIENTVNEEPNMMSQEEFNKHLNDLVENPDLQVIANVVVNLLSEQTGQIQTNVVQAVFMNTLLELLVKTDLINYEEFQKTYNINLKEAEATVQQTFEDAHREAQNHAEASQLTPEA